MIVAKLSSKGQIVIPRAVRDRLHIVPGTRFEVESEKDRIILTPIKKTARQRLLGKYRGESLLEGLERELERH